MKIPDPEKIAREVLDACSDCDVCRFLMDTSCLFFPELYRLYDRELDGGEKITSQELRRLVDLCNFCGQCPCPNIRAGIIEAKSRFIERDGLRFGVRTIEDVKRIATLCGAVPRLTNALFGVGPIGGLLKAAMGVHKARRMPCFPQESFPAWADRHALTSGSRKNQGRRIAFFAGCTGNYLFPQVPKAVVEIFKHNGFEIYFPEQRCCGMPPMLEGDRKVTLEFARFNVERLSGAVEDGYDIVCSCPTCSYMLRTVLGEGAYFSSQFQESVGADEREIKVPVERTAGEGKAVELTPFSRTIYKGIFKDDGYFSSIDPLKRIKVAENTYDLGEYLSILHRSGELSTDFAQVASRMCYYPPCHLREQKIGRPYVELLRMIQGVSLDVIDGAFYCCGLAGVMGFKREYHETSIQLGRALVEKISSLNPDRIVTECLSCRLQFNQLLPYEVVHPVELLMQAYGRSGSDAKAG